ncbi:MAG TPA: 30S ribosomal protein S5 [Caldisericia bacterium]|jgi:small subunit ribosomal protein S5|nr:30S ribosomal protein S5 [Caldisericia bacterium]HOC52712.1 30S ribosomal protein S5 [Caldisericia bacterium]HPB34304.1 30S ribosomal protein S5 [Caldisericia bacterium]HQL66599.1 30S ribosomal protein S5 [Caldisericia bacterium]HQO99848.1 30S ribosomal protein S5 [Caldisericia bacterium]
MIDNEELEITMEEQLVQVRRVAKVTKGGKRLKFRALVVVGNGNGKVGLGLGKANEIPDAIKKASSRARKDWIMIPIKGTTIPHETWGKWGAAKVFLKPAVPGTGIIAGGPVRAILQKAGIRDVLSKAFGSSNQVNVSFATIEALKNLTTYKEKSEILGKNKSKEE